MFSETSRKSAEVAELNRDNRDGFNESRSARKIKSCGSNNFLGDEMSNFSVSLCDADLAILALYR